MRKVILGLFTVISLLVFRPILNNLWYPAHDSTSVARTFLLQQTLSAGQIPAIWTSQLNNGAGYPLFHFYAPLMTYLSLGFKLLTGSYFLGIKLTLILAAISGMIGMYFLTRKWGRVAGIVAASSYALLPYAAVNLYVRGAFAEYLAMALLPWVFYSWTNINTRRKQLLAGFVTTLFLLSHNLIPIITFAFLLVWVLLNKPTKLQSWILPVLLTVGLSAFYLLPLLFERSFVQADNIARTTNYSLHFVDPSQLWNSAWGYGGSAAGLEDGMSFKIGKIHLLLALLGTFLIFIRSKCRELFFVFALIISLFMATIYSSFIWSGISFLSIVQFPWRFLVLGGFFVSVLAGYGATVLDNHKITVWLVPIIVTILLVFNLKYFNPQSTFKENISDFTSQVYLDTLPNIIPEYAPSWLVVESTTKPSSTVLPYLYYPTWEVILDGQKVPTYPSDGYLAFDNPSSSTEYFVRQVHTNLENIASIISLISLIILIKLYVKA